jgi:transposase
VNADIRLLALDSTTISVSLKLCAWALGKYEQGDIKMHTLLDLRGSIPVQIHISDGRWHDSNMLDELKVEPYAMYAADKAYVDLEDLWRINLANAFFVVRPKSNMKFVFKEELTDTETDSNIVGDYVVELARKSAKDLYPGELRFVRATDPETGEVIDFITNTFGLSALEIANIYRHRWDIEVFFRWIKQNIVIKKLWGYSPNAVKTHLWVAICAYLLLAWTKKLYQSDYSITEIATLVSVSLFEKADLKGLLTQPNDKLGYLNSNQNVKELTLF